MAKAKKRKTKVKKAKRAVTARKTKSKKGKRPVKKAVRKTKPVKSKAKKPVAKKTVSSKPKTYKILMMGAAYGSLLAAKMLFGGHQIHHVCLPAEADLINAEGFKVRLPVRGRNEPVVLDSQKLPGKVTASGTAVNPKDFDLIGLAMQEPQYRSPGVRELLDAVAKSRVPCMSIMNMPPLPYVKRIPGLNYDALKPAYTDPTVWDNFDPACLTLCSPDPQAIRPPDEKVNVLMVTLPTNFKVAKFENEKGNVILRQLEQEIDAVRFDPGDGTKIELPVKLRVHDSIFVPLAKWAMLLAGNYRCVTTDGMRTAQEAVHSDIETSRSVYNFVFDLCVKLGAKPADLVPFEKYAAAAQSLTRPASAARALQNGAQNIERADKLVQLIARQKGLSHPAIDAQVALVDARLDANRKKAAA
jgi:hypothetical protein